MKWRFKLYSFFILSITFFYYSCAQKENGSSKKKLNPIAVKYSYEALVLTHPFFTNPDTIKRSIQLIDSSILLEPNCWTFYQHKWTILYRANLFDSALKACSQGLLISPNNFELALNKAVTFDRIGIKDSADLFYNKTLDLIKKQRAAVTKNKYLLDYINNIVLLLLYGNNSLVQQSINKFEEENKGTPYIENYVNQLKTFNKEEYLQNQ